MLPRLNPSLQSLLLLLLLTTARTQELDNEVEEEFDPPPPLAQGEVEVFSDVPCPDGLYADPSRLSSPNTKICVEARLNCLAGTSWKAQCNTCTCSQGPTNIGIIECTQDDCTGYEEPEADFGNSNLCGDGIADCPEGCGFVRRDYQCVYCVCGAIDPALELSEDQESATIEQPAADDEESTTTEQPAADDEKSTTTEQPAASDDKPTITEKPNADDESTNTEQPAADDGPA